MDTRFYITLFLISLPGLFYSQGYTNWIVGDTADVQPGTVQPGTVLAGGGGDNDTAMQWMLSRAGGGDVVVIRASGSDGQTTGHFGGYLCKGVKV